MAGSRKELDQRSDKYPTHRDIERRAYGIYLERGQEEGHAMEHWLTAEVQLLRERGETRASEADWSSNDFAVAEEERIQVRAAEEIKESREKAVLPRTKSAKVGQERTK